VANQITLANHLVAQDGRTQIKIIQLLHDLPGGNVMDVSPGGDPRAAAGGEGILSGSNGSAAHINSLRLGADLAGAVLHDSLHFIPALGDGRKSDGYLESPVTGISGTRSFAGYKQGFTKANIMANTSGSILGASETKFIDNPITVTVVKRN
jgi:hypothetical protein